MEIPSAEQLEAIRAEHERYWDEVAAFGSPRLDPMQADYVSVCEPQNPAHPQFDNGRVDLFHYAYKWRKGWKLQEVFSDITKARALAECAEILNRFE